METNDKPRPKPAPPKTKAPPTPAPEPKEDLAEVEAKTPLKKLTGTEKPKFVRKPHLTERPFKGHEGLQALQKKMTKGQRHTNKEKK